MTNRRRRFRAPSGDGGNPLPHPGRDAWWLASVLGFPHNFGAVHNMTLLNSAQSPTVAAIYAAYEATNDTWDSLGLSVGELGAECDRSLYYSFHWATPAEQVDGRKVRIFRRGDLEEVRLIEDLERIGVEVFGQQDRIRLLAGHIRGKADGRLVGLPEAPKTEHLFEAKSSNEANFKKLQKEGCAKAQPKHFVQCQLGMHAFGLTRAAYVVTNKNDETIYLERINYDFEFCVRLLARAERIVRAGEPPSRISEKPDFFGCRFCKHKAVCHEDAFPRVTCRSCLYSTAEMSGDGHWSCGRWAKPISFDEQKAACPSHLWIPGLVPGEQVDADEAAETVTYKLRANGELWVDGATTKEQA